MHSKNASLFFRSKEHHHHHLFRSAKKRTDPSSSWVNGETSRWVRAVRQPRRTRERRTTSVESAAVGFIQFIIYKSAISDDIIFLSLFLSSATTKRINRHRSLVRRRYVVVVREGVFVGFETEKRSRCFYRFGCANDGSKSAFDSIRIRIRSKIVARKREKTARCRRRAKTREIGRYRFGRGVDATTPRESRFDTFESDLRRLGRMPFW